MEERVNSLPYNAVKIILEKTSLEKNDGIRRKSW